MIPAIAPGKWYYLQFSKHTNSINLAYVTQVDRDIVKFHYLEGATTGTQLGLSAFRMVATQGAETMLQRLDKLPATAHRAEMLALLTEGKFTPFVRRRPHKLSHAVEAVLVHMECGEISLGTEGAARVADVAGYAQADVVLTQWASHIKHEYGEDVRFTVHFADGQIYNGEYVLKAERQQSLGAAMYCYLTWHANIYFPSHRFPNDLVVGDAPEIALNFLKKYDIDAYNGVDAVGGLINPDEMARPTMSGHSQSRFIIGVQPVETLVIAGGEVLDYNDPRPLLVQIMAAKNMRRDENIGVLSEISKMDSELGRRAASLLEQFKQEGK